MSSLHIRELGPFLFMRSVASSKCEYSHEKSSFDMKSLIDDPKGWDRSMTRRRVPSFLGADPIGEQWVLGNGGWGKGPAVWPREISLLIACFIRVLFWSADLRFLGRVSENSPVKPMSKPFLKPFTMYFT